MSLVCHEMITNTSCYHVGRCLLGPLSHTAYEKGEAQIWWCDDLSISRTQMGHFALSNWTLLTNKGQYLPLSAPRPLDGSLIGGADQIKNSWPDVGVKWTGRCY